MVDLGLEALERKIAQEEATLSRLTEALREQRERIALLRRELEQLREALAVDGAAPARSQDPQPLE
jgi:hypothetical protein